LHLPAARDGKRPCRRSMMGVMQRCDVAACTHLLPPIFTLNVVVQNPVMWRLRGCARRRCMVKSLAKGEWRQRREESAMRLMIACPKTGDPIPVASEIERESLVKLPSVNLMVSACAACGERHMWRMTDAWIHNEWRDHLVDAA
jgi:hypothetical protein